MVGSIDEAVEKREEASSNRKLFEADTMSKHDVVECRG
jgi:hypothetical protein